MQIEIISWIEGYDDFVGRYISDALRENDFFLFINQIGDASVNSIEFWKKYDHKS